MSFNISTFQTKLKSAFTQIKKTQSEALAIEIAANFTAGRQAGEKHKSINYQNLSKPIKLIESAEPEEEEEELTKEEKAEIAVLTALFLGYINKFNDVAQAQILAEVKSMVEAGKAPEEIQEYVKNVFAGKESIVIDNTGKKKKEIYVDKDLKLSEVTKIIEKPFFVSLLAYASLLGESVAHTAYEKGREIKLINDGFEKWVFTGPADEVARPHHVALLGSVLEFGTDQSEYAERCLHEPRCRHRKQVYYGDSRDVKKEVFEKMKQDAGLYWDMSQDCWKIKI